MNFHNVFMVAAAESSGTSMHKVRPSKIEAPQDLHIELSVCAGYYCSMAHSSDELRAGGGRSSRSNSAICPPANLGRTMLPRAEGGTGGTPCVEVHAACILCRVPLVQPAFSKDHGSRNLPIGPPKGDGSEEFGVVG